MPLDMWKLSLIKKKSTEQLKELQEARRGDT